MKRTKTLTLAVAVFLLLGISASAQTVIYALGSEVIIKDNGGSVFDETTNQILQNDSFGPSTLYTINPSTGEKTEIGPTGFRECTGLDAHPVTNELYAVCHRIFDEEQFPDERTSGEDDGIGQYLVHIDSNTGQGTEIGALGDAIGYKGTLISDIDFRSDGTLFAYLICRICRRPDDKQFETNNIEDLTGNALGIIDLQTGKFMLIGESGINDNISAIAFTPSQILSQCATFFDEFDFHELRTLNQTNGASTFLSELLIPSDFEDFFTIISSKDADMETGAMYGFLLADQDENGGEFPEAESRNIAAVGSFLTILQPGSNTLQVIGQTAGTQEVMLAIAVMGQPKVVPTLSEYGLILTVALFLGAAVVFLRRRQARSEV